MNAKAYNSLTNHYMKQCGTTTDLWLKWTMAAKWELVAGVQS